MSDFALLLRPHDEPELHRTIMTAAAAYLVLMAVPFMPAVEIGLSMLVISGGKLALLVYLSTVGALGVAYGLGRLLRPEHAARLFGLLGLTRAQRFATRMAPLSVHERLTLLARQSPSRLLPMLLRRRLLLLGVLLNIPGNVVIGGGGGIAMT